MSQTEFDWHDSIKDRERDDCGLILDFGDGCNAPDEWAVADEYLVAG